MTDFTVGDRVIVYYDGEIAESYPAQVNTVYAIVLTSPDMRINMDELYALSAMRTPYVGDNSAVGAIISALPRIDREHAQRFFPSETITVRAAPRLRLPSTMNRMTRERMI